MPELRSIRPARVLGAGAIALVLGFAGGFVFQRATASSKAPSVTAPDTASQVDSKRRFKLPVTDSQPQRGPADALVTVVEWCDLRGDPCRAADRAMTHIMSKYAGRVRWVHRHAIDRAHFDASQRMHAFARGAFQDGEPDDPVKFWQVRDKLLAVPGDEVPGDEVLRRIASEVGVDFEQIDKGIQGKAFAGGLGVDTMFMSRFGIKESPAFFVNGRPVDWSTSRGGKGSAVDRMEAALEPVLVEELAAAERLVKSGIEPSAVYEELTKDGLWSTTDDPKNRPQPRVPPLQSLAPLQHN